MGVESLRIVPFCQWQPARPSQAQGRATLIPTPEKMTSRISPAELMVYGMECVMGTQKHRGEGTDVTTSARCWLDIRTYLAIAVLSVLGAASPFASSAGAAPAVEPPTREQLDFFEKHIRPVLARHCYACHSSDAKTLQAGLRLDTAAGTRRGGDSGPVVISGKAQESLLIESLRYESYEMPPNGQLPKAVVDDFVRWVEMGVPDPEAAQDSHERPAEAANSTTTHWALKPPQVGQPPMVKQADWVRTDVDPFVLGRLEQLEWTPSPPAAPQIWLRRLSYDLLGLPPTAEEVESFLESVAAEGEAAYRAAVDQLLQSPHFGERWGRYWLDVARYADTKGYVFQEDRNYPHAYTYRDWVIGALNDDMPYRPVSAGSAGRRSAGRSRSATGGGLPDSGPPLHQQPARHHRRPDRRRHRGT